MGKISNYEMIAVELMDFHIGTFINFKILL